MAKVYFESAKKWAIGAGIPAGIAGFALIFYYLIYLQAVTITGFSQDQICAGTSMDPCIAMINLTANEDTFLYPLGYDPYGRNTPFETDKELKSWKMFRSWGSGWREINLNKTCTATWCGAPPNSPDNKYSFAFRKGNNYTIKIEALKKNPSEDVKWGFGSKEIGIQSGESFVDPVFLGLNGKNIFPRLIENKADLTGGYAIFEFNNPYNGLDLKKYFNFTFKNSEGEGINDYKFYINYSNISFNPIYGGEYEANTTCHAVENTKEIEYSCVKNVSDIIGYKEKISEGWRPANETIKKGFYKVRIEASWKAQLGPRAIDWQPKTTYSRDLIMADKDIIVDKPEWAWWNSSCGRKRQMNFTIPNNDTLEVAILNLSSSNFSNANADGSDFRFVDSGETTTFSYFQQDRVNSSWWRFRVELNNVTSGYIYWDCPSFSSLSDINSVYIVSLEQASKIVAAWFFDETSGNLKDYVGGINLIANGTPMYNQTGRVDGAIGFNSTDDYFNQSNSSLNVIDFQNLTKNPDAGFQIGFWINTNSTLADVSVLSSNDDAFARYDFTLENFGGSRGHFGWNHYDVGGGFTGAPACVGCTLNRSTSIVNDTVWKFITSGVLETFGSDDKYTMWWNQTLFQASDSPDRNASAKNLVLGDIRTGSLDYFNGMIDEMYIVNLSTGLGINSLDLSNIMYTFYPSYVLGNESTIYPQINISYPENTTYNFGDSPTKINYTALGTFNVSQIYSCWYSLNGGITNSTPTRNCENFTGINASVGFNNWTVYTNNSAGFVSSSRVFFTVDYFNISITPLTQLYFFPNATLVNATNAFNQTSSRGVFTMNNNLGRNINISAKLNQTVANITLKLGNTSSYSNSIIINTTFKLIYNNFTAGNTTQLWAWADYNGSASIWFPQLEITNSS